MREKRRRKRTCSGVVSHMALLNKGTMLADDDAISNRKSYSKTVKCISQVGEVLAMKKTDFFQRVKVH